MFVDSKLQKYLEESPTIKSQAKIIAEWNLNNADNVDLVGNYRYRPTTERETNPYFALPTSFEREFEDSTVKNYFGATNSYTAVDGGVSALNLPTVFVEKDQKENMLYSLSDCLGKFRPRSGINKLRYFDGNYLNNVYTNMANRPRYYLSHKDDKFKYWTSYRTENFTDADGNVTNNVFGIANDFINDKNYISDAAPFVKYLTPVPTNKIVVKMQTHVGTATTGDMSDDVSAFTDPFYGEENKATPLEWEIQYLDGQSWVTAISFSSQDIREDGSPIIREDGYVELLYGLLVPNEYKNVFLECGELMSDIILPKDPANGSAYLVKEADDNVGLYYIWINGSYQTFLPKYGWYLGDDTGKVPASYVTDLTSPKEFTNSNNKKTYREFVYIDGIRIAVRTMNKYNSTFDLIEMSPRLVVDLSDKTTSVNATRVASDLGRTGLPVGQLLASTGTVQIFDYDQALNSRNVNSILNSVVRDIDGSISVAYSNTAKNVQVKIYEMIIDNDNNMYQVPIKTFYVDGFPETNQSSRSVSIQLRDMFLYFESMTAPQVFMQNVKLSYAVTMLLDSIGFSNYIFKFADKDVDMVITDFVVGPDITVAEVLNNLAASAQCAMFFDENNNFIVAGKHYMLPAAEDTSRKTDATLYGTDDFSNLDEDGNASVVENRSTNAKLTNIVDIDSQQSTVFNDGRINYTVRYIQKSYGSINQAQLLDREKTWIYKPALLWEISGEDSTKAINDESTKQSTYVLSAMPLASDYLSDQIPEVVDNQIINNEIDFGENVYWVSRYNGYFHSNGEILRYDAVQYNVPGTFSFPGETSADSENTVWISSVEEYKRYFAELKFNGKIYPTGKVRIFAEPKYEKSLDGTTRLKNGPVTKHGRGQFGTKFANHYSGAAPEWLNTESGSPDNNVSGIVMDSKKLFNYESATVTSTVAEVDNVALQVTATSPSAATTPKITSLSTKAKTFKITKFNKLSGVAVKVGDVLTATKIAGTMSGGVYRVTAISTDGKTLAMKYSGTAPKAGTIKKIMKTSTSTFSTKNIDLIKPGQIISSVSAGSGSFYGSSTRIVTVNPSAKTFTTSRDSEKALSKASIVVNNPVVAGPITSAQGSVYGTGASMKTFAQDNLSTSSTIKNFLNSSYTTEGQVQSGKSSPPATVQASALVLSNDDKPLGTNSLDPVYFVKKNIANDEQFLPNKFGTRMRIIGNTISDSQKTQAPVGSSTMFVTTTDANSSNPNQPVNIGGSSGGLAVMLDENTGYGYYFEIAALTEAILSGYNDVEKINNVLFYKVGSNGYYDYLSSDKLNGDYQFNLDSSTLTASANAVLSINVLDGDGTKSVNPRVGDIVFLTNQGEASTPQNNENGLWVVSSVGSASAKWVMTRANISAENATPQRLWAGFSQILVDDGMFTGQHRMKAESQPSVYDLSVEYKVMDGKIRFNLYLNDRLLAIVDDNNPLIGSDGKIAINKSAALFIRGTSKCMFEHIYALKEKVSSRSEAVIGQNVGDDTITSFINSAQPLKNQAFSKYSMNSVVNATYLSQISAFEPPKFDLYYEEFGAIMREASYVKFRYDKAYPALYAKLSPTFNALQGYAVSGFAPTAYGAEFLVFNITDTVLSLDETSGNFLRVQGITFTQDSQHTLTVDEFFSQKSDFADVEYLDDSYLVSNKDVVKQVYDGIKKNRMTFGKQEFVLDAPYVQNSDAAYDLMSWMTGKMVKPRFSVSISMFSMPTLQLGDIVEIKYSTSNLTSGTEPFQQIPDSRFVVYSIEYSRDKEGPSMKIGLSEVV
jgi:hypothetical protein